jgi:hypothetical protein
MTLGALRKWTVLALLGVTAATILFFLVAPSAGFPLEFDQAWGIAQISVPVLAGYLGTATQFAGSASGDDADPSPPLLPWLVFTPMAIYLLAAAILLVVFGLTNRSSAPVGTGMSATFLSTVLTGLLGIVTVTANVAIARLFRKG